MIIWPLISFLCCTGLESLNWRDELFTRFIIKIFDFLLEKFDTFHKDTLIKHRSSNE